MNVHLSQRVIEQLAAAPLAVQKAFIKQISFLSRNLGHPSLHAKKYNEAEDLWQARVNQDWRFYFTIAADTYRVENLIPHPKKWPTLQMTCLYCNLQFTATLQESTDSSQ